MPDIEFTISGLTNLIDLLEKAPGRMRKEVSTELYRFAEEVMNDSKQIVPVDTGALMSTGKVMPPVDNGNQIDVTLGYGDESVDYALIVHEELQSPSGNPINWMRPGSGPKFLETPLKAKQDQLPGRIVDAVKKAFT